jgi:predicted phage baseplate assembly protein
MPPAVLAWEYSVDGGAWAPLTVEQDETAALLRSGAVVLSVPQDAVSTQDRVWVRSRIVRGQYDIEPRLRRVAVNVLSCAQRETVPNEELGRGNARPDQWFELARGPILIPESGSPVRVAVAGDEWRYVSSFDDSTPEGREFTFDPRSRRVSFGNGLNGRVPMPGEDVRASYQTSAGTSGNVAKGLAWKFRSANVAGVALTNPAEGSGGADPESLDEMELRARALLNRPNRAVTLADIERLALGTPGAHVARAHALVNCPAPERITIVAVPKVRPGRTGPPASPSDAFLTAVRRHLEPRRLLCDNLRVVRPLYVEVQVSARLRLSKGAGPAAVVERAHQALDRFLSGETSAAIAEAPAASAAPLPCPTRWPIGRSVFPSDIYAVLDRVAGVDSVSGVVLSARRDGASIAPDSNGTIRMPATGLVFPGAHNVSVESGSGRPG